MGKNVEKWGYLGPMIDGAVFVCFGNFDRSARAATRATRRAAAAAPAAPAAA